MHTFVLILIMHSWGSLDAASASVGPYYTPQSCLEAKAAALRQPLVSDAFCMQVDRQ
jgi:hypothetical protein